MTCIQKSLGDTALTVTEGFSMLFDVLVELDGGIELRIAADNFNFLFAGVR